MRRVSPIFALLVLTQLAPGAWAKALPEKVGYTIYSRGEEVGHSAITITRTSDAVVFESTASVQFTPTESIELTCHTVADPKTFLIREFDFHGQRAGTKIEGRIEVEGDSLYGTVYRDDVELSSYKKSSFDRHLMLEDFVLEHEILIALAHEAAGVNPAEYGLLFPATITMAKATVAFASTLEIESDTQAVVCKKIIVAIEGSSPYAVYYDPERRLPVYMAFPQTSVEVFLDDFFGDSPVSRFRE